MKHLLLVAIFLSSFLLQAGNEPRNSPSTSCKCFRLVNCIADPTSGVDCGVCNIVCGKNTHVSLSAVNLFQEETDAKAACCNFNRKSTRIYASCFNCRCKSNGEDEFSCFNYGFSENGKTLCSLFNIENGYSANVKRSCCNYIPGDYSEITASCFNITGNHSNEIDSGCFNGACGFRSDVKQGCCNGSCGEQSEAGHGCCNCAYGKKSQAHGFCNWVFEDNQQASSICQCVRGPEETAGHAPKKQAMGDDL